MMEDMQNDAAKIPKTEQTAYRKPAHHPQKRKENRPAFLPAGEENRNGNEKERKACAV